MKVVFKHEQTKYLDLQYMAYLDQCEYFEDANCYDNWYEIRTSVYNNLFVYCAENGLDDELKKLKKLKDF